MGDANFSELTFVASMVIIASGLQRLSGIGFGLIIAPTFLLVAPPNVALWSAILLCGLSAPWFAVNVVAQRRSPALHWLAAGALAGVPLGFLANKFVPEPLLLLVFAGLLAFAASRIASGGSAPADLAPLRRSVLAMAGVVSGSMGAMFASPGPAAAWGLHAAGVPHHMSAALIRAYLFLSYASMAAVGFLLHYIPLTSLQTALLLTPLAWVSGLVADRWLRVNRPGF